MKKKFYSNDEILDLMDAWKAAEQNIELKRLELAQAIIKESEAKIKLADAVLKDRCSGYALIGQNTYVFKHLRGKIIVRKKC